MTGSGHILAESRRFTIGRRLGQGGMGVVFEAYDRQRQEVVALKTLTHSDSTAVYRLKQEFRALANVAHPNLVSLYELFAEGEEWFFTMELIEGVSLTDHIRPVVADAEGDPEGRPVRGPLDIARLRSAFQQLVAGVVALHDAGKVHRDLKPSNVLVTPAGRVVILDLGIARDLRPTIGPTTTGTKLAGTVDYMSPEQARGLECTGASDWYSVGVILYEALTGTVPFTGPAIAVLVQKEAFDVPRIEGLTPNPPADLVELCHDLLARDPEARPTDSVILQRLGLTHLSPAVSRARPERGGVVGRAQHLAALESALAASRRGHTVTVYVHGLSGMGKSTVVEHFLHRVKTERRALVLAGRCYDRESVPYKAFDGMIDSLARYLRTLPPRELKAVLPNDVHMVARLFPVLRRVDAIADELPGRFESPDPVELRRRAVTALAALFARLAAHIPIVLHVDDLQWSDADSITLGRTILEQRRSTPLLLILSFRSEEVPANPVLQAFLAGAGTNTRRELSVGPLSPSESRELASSLLHETRGDTHTLIDLIVREAAGSPFFIEQLARHVAESENAESVSTGLGDMVDARINRLPPGARQFLQTLAPPPPPAPSAAA